MNSQHECLDKPETGQEQLTDGDVSDDALEAAAGERLEPLLTLKAFTCWPYCLASS